MKPETLTEMERLQLANQYAILEKLDPHDAKHWAECKEIVQRGYTLSYGKMFDPIWDELSYDDCRYVFDVLAMHDALQRSFERLADKAGLSESDVAFHGFSGNEETHLLAFAQYIRDSGQWDWMLKGKDLDSHFPTEWRYKAMLEKWKPIEPIERKAARLSKEDIKEILEEPGKRVREQRAAG